MTASAYNKKTTLKAAWIFSLLKNASRENKKTKLAEGGQVGTHPPHPLHFFCDVAITFFHLRQHLKLKKLLTVKRRSTIESWTWQKYWSKGDQRVMFAHLPVPFWLVSLAEHLFNYLTYLRLKSWSYCIYVGCFYLRKICKKGFTHHYMMLVGLFVWSKSLIACKQDLVLLGFYSRRADSQAKSLKTNLFKLLVSWWRLLIFFTCWYPDSVLFRNSISTHGKYPYFASETFSSDFDKFYSLAAFSLLLKTCDMFILKVLVLQCY